MQATRKGMGYSLLFAAASLKCAATTPTETKPKYSRPVMHACTIWAGLLATKYVPLAKVSTTSPYVRRSLVFVGIKMSTVLHTRLANAIKMWKTKTIPKVYTLYGSKASSEIMTLNTISTSRE